MRKNIFLPLVTFILFIFVFLFSAGGAMALTALEVYELTNLPAFTDGSADGSGGVSSYEDVAANPDGFTDGGLYTAPDGTKYEIWTKYDPETDTTVEVLSLAPDSGGGGTPTVSCSSGSSNHLLYTIQGVVYVDANKNGQRDISTEVGAPGTYELLKPQDIGWFFGGGSVSTCTSQACQVDSDCGTGPQYTCNTDTRCCSSAYSMGGGSANEACVTPNWSGNTCSCPQPLNWRIPPPPCETKSVCCTKTYIGNKITMTHLKNGKQYITRTSVEGTPTKITPTPVLSPPPSYCRDTDTTGLCADRGTGVYTAPYPFGVYVLEISEATSLDLSGLAPATGDHQQHEKTPTPTTAPTWNCTNYGCNCRFSKCNSGEAYDSSGRCVASLCCCPAGKGPTSAPVPTLPPNFNIALNAAPQGYILNTSSSVSTFVSPGYRQCFYYSCSDGTSGGSCKDYVTSYPVNVEFGVAKASPTPTPTPTPILVYTVSGKVFIDKNGNGQKDSDDNTCYNGSVQIIMGAVSKPFASTTDCNASYSISNTTQCAPVQLATIPQGYKATGWSGTDPMDSAIGGTGKSAYFCPTATTTPTPTPRLTITPTPILTITPTISGGNPIF
jgi:hypothetical protein